MGLLLNPEFVTLFSWQWFNGSVISRVIYVEIDFFLLLSLSLSVYLESCTLRGRNWKRWIRRIIFDTFDFGKIDIFERLRTARFAMRSEATWRLRGND